MMNNRGIAFVLSVSLYSISLLCPVFAFKEGDSSFLAGFVCLLFGAFSGHLAWFANPLYLAALITLLMKKHYISVIFSVSALVIASTTLSIKEIERNEAGDMTAVVGYGPGFHLWLYSMLLALVAAVIGILKPEASNLSQHSTAEL